MAEDLKKKQDEQIKDEQLDGVNGGADGRRRLKKGPVTVQVNI